MRKNSIFALSILTFVVFAFSSMANARIIYKDINSISLRTNFSFDYETITTDGVDDVTFSNEGDDGSNVFIYDAYKNKSYLIESAEWYRESTDDFSIGSEPKVIVYLTTNEYNYDASHSDNEYYYRFLSSYNSSNCAISNATFVFPSGKSNTVIIANKIPSPAINTVFTVTSILTPIAQEKEPIQINSSFKK